MSSTVSLIVDAAITRLEALDAVARAAHATVSDPGTSSAHVMLAEGAVAVVEIPKFGEAPPLAIDVTAAGEAEARTAADRLLAELHLATEWSITRLG